IAVQGIAPAAATTRMRQNHALGRQIRAEPIGRAKIILAGLQYEALRGRADRAAPQAPGRAALAVGGLEIPAPLDKAPRAHLEPDTAAEFARPARIRAEAALLDEDRNFQLHRFDRSVAHIALADRNAGGFAILGGTSAPARALDALGDEAPLGLGIDAEENDRAAAHHAVMRRRNLVRHGGRERGDHDIDDGRQDSAPARHRRGIARHHDVALGQDDVECAERALIHGRHGLRQRLVGDAGAGEGARVESALSLARASREVDRHLAALDRDLGVDVDPLQPLGCFVVEEGARLVNAVGHALDHRPALRLSLVENLRDAMEHRRFAVALEELVDAPQREAAGGDLRAQIAERAFRKADVVADDAIERFVALAGFVELQLVELQPFLPRIDEIAPRAEAGAGAANIDPMRPHHREQHQLALEEIGHIDDDVVEVLPRHGLVIHDEDIAGGEAVLAIDPDAVGDDDAEIGDEMRDAADILAEQLALGVDEGGAEIPYLVDHHIVGGAL